MAQYALEAVMMKCNTSRIDPNPYFYKTKAIIGDPDLNLMQGVIAIVRYMATPFKPL